MRFTTLQFVHRIDAGVLGKSYFQVRCEKKFIQKEINISKRCLACKAKKLSCATFFENFFSTKICENKIHRTLRPFLCAVKMQEMQSH